MKKLSCIYHIELSANEVETIVNALHSDYKRGLAMGDNDSSAVMHDIRVLRNDLASLINKAFMGADA